MPEIIVILGPTGQIEAQVLDGSFAGGKAAIAALLATLGQQLPLVQVSDVEAHRTEDATEGAHQSVHMHSHLHEGGRHG
ncbi:MAG TPA: hypothetical protein VFM49_06685 [Chloroflexia bacterium]|jgi:hypothetical protein|nr:hypothetical protein [Chloroflexia bacterium]